MLKPKRWSGMPRRKVIPHQSTTISSSSTNFRTSLSTQGDRHGQRRAKRQSGNQETQEGEDQGDCRGTEPEGRGLAADLGYRQEEIMLEARRPRRTSFSVSRSHGLPEP